MVFFHPELGDRLAQVFVVFLHSIQANVGSVNEIKPQALPFTPFATHCSQVIVSFDATRPQLLTTLLDK